MSVKLQVYAFAAAITLLAALVVWAAHSAWGQLQVLRGNFATVRAETFSLSEQVEARLLDLNATVLRFISQREDFERAAFDQESLELKQMLKAYQDVVTTQQESDLLLQLDIAFEDYATNAAAMIAEPTKPGASLSTELALERITVLADPVLDLIAHLKEAERVALNQFVTESHKIVEGLRVLLIVSVVLVVLLGFTAARLTYRTRIAPLRAQVIQSRALLERQEKLASLGTLAAGVAHEIRNPLTAINVRVHSLKKTLPDASSEREDILVIDEEIRRLDRIVRGCLDFARPSAPRLLIVQVESILTRVQNLLGAQWKNSAIAFHVQPAPDLWIRVDTHQMEQVLINLLQNAADSIEGPGRITLRARAEQRRLGGRNVPAVILEVADTGSGILPETQKRIFDPFFTTKETGTGLGLAIAASIVETHGGVLQCQTQVGRGTTFSIVLPRAESDEHESQA